MNKLQQQVFESFIDISEVFDSTKLQTKSYSNNMEKRRKEEQLIMDARIRNIKKDYHQKYEILHSTYLYQYEQLKQQLQSEIKKEMYSFEQNLNNYLNKMSTNDKSILKGGLSLDYQISMGQSNHIQQTLNTEQTLNKSSTNDLFNFVDSHDNSLFHKNPHSISMIQPQSSIATFSNNNNNQPSSFRNGGVSHNIQETWNKENILEQSRAFLNNSQKNYPILKNSQLANQNTYRNDAHSFQMKAKQNKLNKSFEKTLYNNQSIENVASNQKSKNWETIKQIRQQSKEQFQYPLSSQQVTNKREKTQSLHNNNKNQQNQNDNNSQNSFKYYDNNQRMNNSFQISKRDNSFCNNKQLNNLSFTNLNQFENQGGLQHCSSYSSSDSEGDRQLDTNRLKRFKIDNICLGKNINSNQNRVLQQQYFYK